MIKVSVSFCPEDFVLKVDLSCSWTASFSDVLSEQSTLEKESESPKEEAESCMCAALSLIGCLGRRIPEGSAEPKVSGGHASSSAKRISRESKEIVRD